MHFLLWYSIHPPITTSGCSKCSESVTDFLLMYGRHKRTDCHRYLQIAWKEQIKSNRPNCCGWLLFCRQTVRILKRELFFCHYPFPSNKAKRVLGCVWTNPTYCFFLIYDGIMPYTRLQFLLNTLLFLTLSNLWLGTALSLF